MRLNLSTPPSVPRPEASEMMIHMLVAALEWAFEQTLIPEDGIAAARLVGTNARTRRKTLEFSLKLITLTAGEVSHA